MSRPVPESVEEEVARIRQREAEAIVLRRQARDRERVRKAAERKWFQDREIQQIMRRG